MGFYILRRLLLIPPLLLVLSMVIFGIVHLAPGDPTAALLSPEQLSDPVARARMRAQWGLDQPLPVQYAQWLGKAVRGDFGNSFTGPRVTDMLGPAIMPTIGLQGAALALAILIAVPIGIASALRRYSLFDNLSTGVSFLGISLPDFWFALLLQLLFAVQLGWLPSSTMGDAEPWPERLRYLAMPVAILAMARMASFVRFMRGSMLEVLEQDYMVSARAKGLAESSVILRHALRNALIPMITAVGLAMPRLIGGAVIVESIFAWPGLGKLAVDVVLRRDYPVMMALTLLTGAFVLVVNLVVDLLYAAADPRIVYEEKPE